MTDLEVRKMRFGFAEADVPFVWNESNPAFSSAANAMSFLFIAVEKMITHAVAEAIPLITDPEVATEAEAFLRQEGQHSMAHRQHVNALMRRYPALQGTLDEVVAAFDGLTATKSLKYRLAYVADMESTFTPTFRMLLNNADTLFAPGDDRVASLFLWHFVEEVEHRSSALMIYNAVVGSSVYRMRVAPSVFRHARDAMVDVAVSFNKHVPLSERKTDALWMYSPSARPAPAGPQDGPSENAYEHIPRREILATVLGVVRSQLPGHRPSRAKLPALASEWLARYDAGYDVTRWYTATQSQPA